MNDVERILLTRGIETWAMIGEDSLAELRGSGTARHLAGEVALREDASSPQGCVPILAKGAIVVAFPYDPRTAIEPRFACYSGLDDHPDDPEPRLRVGAFASAHRYAALTRLLKTAARELASTTDHPYADFRVAVNSRLPEKDLAELAGLGHRGRSDLLLSHAYGPACILGVLLLPFDPLGAIAAADTTVGARDTGWERTCGSCSACARACPGHAIDGPNSSADCSTGRDLQITFRRETCVQHWMSTMEEPPAGLRPAFSGRLYGCDECILACPYTAGAWRSDRTDGSSPASRAEALMLPLERRPGASVSASFLMRAGDDELKAFFRKTALGLSWSGPRLLRRNAELAIHDSGTAKPPVSEGLN